MKFSLIILIALSLVALTGDSVGALEEYEPILASSRSPTTRLLKRSLCNTFGGCGAKRSIMPLVGGYKISDESSDERRYEADERMITEILEGILEHLQKDHNYKQGKYVMYVPKQTRSGGAGTRQQQLNQDEEPDRRQQHRIQANDFEELRIT